MKVLALIKQVDQKSFIIVTINKGFKSQSYVCNKCHDLLMMSMNLSDIAVIKIKNADYCCNIIGISKSEAIKILQNMDLTENSRTL